MIQVTPTTVWTIKNAAFRARKLDGVTPINFIDANGGVIGNTVRTDVNGVVYKNGSQMETVTGVFTDEPAVIQYDYGDGSWNKSFEVNGITATDISNVTSGSGEFDGIGKGSVTNSDSELPDLFNANSDTKWGGDEPRPVTDEDGNEYLAPPGVIRFKDIFGLLHGQKIQPNTITNRELGTFTVNASMLSPELYAAIFNITGGGNMKVQEWNIQSRQATINVDNDTDYVVVTNIPSRDYLEYQSQGVYPNMILASGRTTPLKFILGGNMTQQSSTGGAVSQQANLIPGSGIQGAGGSPYDTEGYFINVTINGQTAPRTVGVYDDRSSVENYWNYGMTIYAPEILSGRTTPIIEHWVSWCWHRN